MIGIDILKINRFKKINKIDFTFWDKFFTKEEWEYAFLQSNFYERLAGIFAAKEAVIKADAKRTIKTFDQIEIKHLKNGCPYAKILTKSDLKINISISHEKNIAIAVAIIK